MQAAENAECSEGSYSERSRDKADARRSEKKMGENWKNRCDFLYILWKLFTLLDDLSYTFFSFCCFMYESRPENGRNIARSSREIRNTITHSTRRNTPKHNKNLLKFLTQMKKEILPRKKRIKRLRLIARYSIISVFASFAEGPREDEKKEKS